MTPALTGFTSDELDLLETAVCGFIGEFQGACPADVIETMQALQEKVSRMRLIGQKVVFPHEEQYLVGELRGYLDWEDLLMAEIVCKGYIYRVGADSICEA
jgi:hypothetical protein